MPPTNRYIRQNWSPMGLWARAADAACIAAALAWAAWRLGPSVDGRWTLLGTAAIAAFFLVAEVTGLYRSWRGVTAGREIGCVLATWCGTLLVLLVADHLGLIPAGLRIPAFWLVLTPLLVVVGRVVVRALLRLLRSRGINTTGFAIVGVTELGIDLARNIEQSPELGLKLVGFYDDRPAERTTDLPADVGRRIGTIGELVEQARRGQVQLIYITFPMRAEDRIRGVLNELSDTTASVYLVPDFFVFQLLHSRWADINGLPVVSVFDSPFYGVDGVVKRVLDLVLASAALVALALPMSVIALLIKCTSPGPVFFRQRRYGLDGREIRVWKFRTMRVCEDGPQVVQAKENDDRVTPIGAVLRRTSLDELPQLFNVLQGTMSLVGPRPHATAHNEQYRRLIQGYMLRHKVKPGITGLAQVNGWRGETDTLEKMERRVECDHQYIREWSLWLDLKILLKTLRVVWSRENAY